ncbi:hypothetical protein HWB76_gp070 [Streptomyces phage Blueeyedbeauty]|uniref:Uncharacterized protein n=1 Tax=Streptomyces phage Blueeyedbeauty TaxID=2250336 RepID=A0A345L228_9CAUD|nr:hypothetical protein HWB76_gp070 [Streptomyces phage Blueeyedbeauty]AXH49330.1 hypothetical protein SEA_BLUEEYEDBEAUTY_223 [Streptomyces phage Blueeyedbeauty]
MKKREYQDPAEELIIGCLGRILLIGILLGAVFVGAIWGLVELFQWAI